ncbi:hypothetical protein AB5J62_23050 [Amycolatopsis sp. cg5]|uniref:hypothetical protein n=1 Tax=Amycolatopsis sp. cg5 TaxID=3238802 RepID=UPI003524F885
MRKAMAMIAVALSGLAVISSVTGGGVAQAGNRRCGPAVKTDGLGTLGTSWKLKSQYDDDGPVGNPLVAGEEFEIATAAGQHWSVSFADNGAGFFGNPDDISVAGGIREVHPNPARHNQANRMSVHAKRLDTGETIDGFVDLPFAPPNCG